MGASVAFYARTFDKDGDDLIYRWDFGDGESFVTKSPSVFHAFDQVGIFSVSVEVDDQLGGVGSDSIVFEVSESSLVGSYLKWVEINASGWRSEEARLPEKDNDRDGLSNLMEYGLGMNPGSVDRMDHLFSGFADLMRGESVEFTFRKNDPDLMIHFYVSEDMERWDRHTLFYEDNAQDWFFFSRLITIEHSEDQEGGFWTLKLNIAEGAAPMFLKLGMEYDL